MIVRQYQLTKVIFFSHKKEKKYVIAVSINLLFCEDGQVSEIYAHYKFEHGISYKVNTIYF